MTRSPPICTGNNTSILSSIITLKPNHLKHINIFFDIFADNVAKQMRPPMEDCIYDVFCSCTSVAMVICAAILALFDPRQTRRFGWVVVLLSGVASCSMRTVRMLHRQCHNIDRYDHPLLFVDYALAILSYVVAFTGVLGDTTRAHACAAAGLMVLSHAVRWSGFGQCGSLLHSVGHVVIAYTLIVEAQTHCSPQRWPSGYR